MTAPGPAIPGPAVDSEGVDGPVLRGLVVGVLCANAVLLALSELAWIWLRIGAVPVPVAALVAAVTTPLLVLAAGIAMPGTRAPLVVLGAWLLPLLVVGLGAGLLPADWRGIVLLGSGVVPGMLAANRRRPTPEATDATDAVDARSTRPGAARGPRRRARRARG